MHALLASHNHEVYRLTIATIEDVQDTLRGVDIAALSAGPFDFWVRSSLQGSRPMLNHTATKLLLGASPRFTARDVPLLRGNVVVTVHDGEGQLSGLSPEQIEWLADFRYDLKWSQEIVLDWRLRRAERADGKYRRARINEANRMLMANLGGPLDPS